MIIIPFVSLVYPLILFSTILLAITNAEIFAIIPNLSFAFIDKGLSLANTEIFMLENLLNRVRGLAEAAYQAQVGSIQEVLFETPDKGRSSGSFWVKAARYYPVGSVQKLHIEKAVGTLLFARD